MATIYPPVTISAIPPFPALSRRATGEYNGMCFTFAVHMGGDGDAAVSVFVPEINALVVNVNANATAAAELASEADDSATAADDARVAAQLAQLAAEAAVASIDPVLQPYLGVQASDPATRLDGSPLQPGDWYVNSATGFIRAYNNDHVWVQAVGGSASVTAINGRAGAFDLPVLLTYADRGLMRAQEAWRHVLVDGLGWFQWTAGSTEPDDDESCFATANGRWLLEAPHWDVVDTWTLPFDAYHDDLLARTLPYTTRSGTATCAITTVATVASATFTATVVGAVPGDRVLAFPPAALGSTSADTARLSFYAYVSALDVVTVVLCNASASTATVAAAVQTVWPITVFKEI